MKCVKIYNYEWAAHGYLGRASMKEIIPFLCHRLKCVYSSSAAKKKWKWAGRRITVGIPS